MSEIAGNNEAKQELDDEVFEPRLKARMPALPHEAKADPVTDAKAASVAAAKAVLMAEREQRVRDCNVEIAAVLRKYGCTFNVVPARLELVPVND